MFFLDEERDDETGKISMILSSIFSPFSFCEQKLENWNSKVNEVKFIYSFLFSFFLFSIEFSFEFLRFFFAGKRDWIFWEIEGNEGTSSFFDRNFSNRETIEYFRISYLSKFMNHSAPPTLSCYKKFKNFQSFGKFVKLASTSSGISRSNFKFWNLRNVKINLKFPNNYSKRCKKKKQRRNPWLERNIYSRQFKGGKKKKETKRENELFRINNDP